MSYANGTTHYNLPQTVGTDKRDWADPNQAFADIDAAIYGAVQDTAQAALDIDALETRMDTAEQGISTNAGNIAGLDTRLTTAEGAITSQGAQITDTRQDLEDMICAYNEASATSTHAYAIGDYFIYNDVLYKATAAIGIGDTIVPDTNCATTNVTTELLTTEDLSGDVTQLQADFGTLQTNISNLSDSPNNTIINKFSASTGTTVRELAVELSNLANLPDFTNPDVMYNCKLLLIGAGNAEGIYNLVRANSGSLFFIKNEQNWESGGNSVAQYTFAIEINISAHVCFATKVYVKYTGTSGTASAEFVRDDLSIVSATSMTLYA